MKEQTNKMWHVDMMGGDIYTNVHTSAHIGLENKAEVKEQNLDILGAIFI